jgi:hypothetical protein
MAHLTQRLRLQADEASKGAPSDPVVIRKLNNAICDIEHFIVQ